MTVSSAQRPDRVRVLRQQLCGAYQHQRKRLPDRVLLLRQQVPHRWLPRKNINALKLETFVVQQLKASLKAQDYSKAAQEIANQVNGASADLSAERAELTSVKGKIANGVRAVLSGIDIPELQAEMDRLRVRQSELEDIIARASSQRPQVDPAAIEAMLREDAERIDSELSPADLTQLLRQYVTKIYAHVDGSCTVNIGVHMSGASVHNGLN